MCSRLVLVLVTFSCFFNTNAQQSIVIQLDGVKSHTGTIRAALYNSEKNFLSFEEVFDSTLVEVEGDSIKIEFKNIPDGTYAVALYHDVNANEKMDTNFMGIPTEPLAFSMASMGLFGPPSFKKASFYHQKNTVLNISL